MIKLRSRDGSRFELGYRKARALVMRRIPENVIADLFGATTASVSSSGEG